MELWSRTTEREILDLERDLRAVAERLEQLRRQRDRGPAPLTESARLEVQTHMEFATRPCALCRRDHYAPIGPELFAKGTSEPVCWACAMAIDPMLTAEVLGQVAEYAERDALHQSDYLKNFISRVRKALPDRADRLERRHERVQQLLRRSKQEGWTDPETWLPAPR